MSILSLSLAAQDFKLVEITRELEPSGKVILTFKFTPAKTQTIEQLTFECTFHQEFPFEDSDGRKYTKIHEPEKFTYKRKDEKFVEELDNYINFRVPLTLELLKPMYGEKTFNDKYPVSISKVKVTAKDAGKKLWEYSFSPPEGKYLWNSEKKCFEASKE